MGVSKLTFGDWLPDQPGVSGHLTEATNVYPIASGYAPLRNLSVIGNAASEALTASWTGKYGAAVSLFAGSATKLYKFNATSLNYDDVSKAGYYSGSFLDNTQFGRVIIVSNGNAKLQSWNLSSSTVFADLSAGAPAAKYVTVVRDFVVAGNISGSENLVQWSDINDETNWVPGVTSQADQQYIADGGNVQGLTGGEFGLVFLEKSIYRMTYSGSPLFFQFDNVARGHGCIAPNSIVQFKNITYYLSDDGFYMCNGQTVTEIGSEKVDRFFFNDVNSSLYDLMSSAVDPIKKLIVWNYLNKNGTYSQLIYHLGLNKWSYGSIQTSYVSTVLTVTKTLEQLNAYGTVDTITTSFDSGLWSATKLLLSGISDKRIGTLDGDYLPSVITTGDIENQGMRSVVTMVRPIIDSGTASVSAAGRNILSNAITYSAASVVNADGRAPIRAAGRYIRYKFVPTSSWNFAVGFEAEYQSQGTR